DEADVVHVLTGAIDTEQVDDEPGIDAHRRERHLTGAPLLDALGCETEHVGVPRERPLYVGDVQHDVVEAPDVHRPAQYRGLGRLLSDPLDSTPMAHKIAVIGGDGIGPEVTAEALKVMGAAG